jgi:hypothetical protein
MATEPRHGRGGTARQVLLSTKYLQLKNSGARKLLPKWIGQFNCGTNWKGRLQVRFTCKLQDSPSVPLGVSFIQSFLKGKDLSGRDRLRPPPPPPLELEDGSEYDVERILSHRDRKIRTNGKRTVIRRDYLVSWVEVTGQSIICTNLKKISRMRRRPFKSITMSVLNALSEKRDRT